MRFIIAVQWLHLLIIQSKRHTQLIASLIVHLTILCIFRFMVMTIQQQKIIHKIMLVISFRSAVVTAGDISAKVSDRLAAMIQI
jgi:hypothetical protein